MSERDELAPITRAYGHGGIKLTAYPSSGRIGIKVTAENAVMDWWELFEFVDQIRKLRTITTTEELDALPNGSVIITSQGEALIANKEYRHGVRVRHWYYGGAGVLRSESIDLPATVLYEPAT